MGASKHTRDIQTWGVSKNTGRCPNIWGTFKHTGVYPNISGHPDIQGVHPNIWGDPNIQGASKHIGASECMEVYGQPLSLTKHAFFMLFMYRWHPNIWRVSKHMGVQMYWGHKDTP